MLNLTYDITQLKGADYNPRHCSEQDLKILAKSIEQLGMVKPLICRKNILVAGHQRSKALRKLGISEAPVYVLGNETTIYDEVRFNQLHNGTDMDAGDEKAKLNCSIKLGYQQVEHKHLTANFRGALAVVRTEISRLIIKYGGWGGVVATLDGEIIHCSQYALACYLTQTPITVYGVPSERKQEYQRYLNKKYGQFCYDHLPKNTYIQTFAQMNRLRGESNLQSSLYKNFAESWIKSNPKAIGLDFGCGHGDYVKKLTKEGCNIIGVELFRRVGSSNTFDISSIQSAISAMVAKLKTSRFDYVILDSVLNSIDCDKAEESVMTFCNAVLKENGLFFFSGRPRERIESQLKCTVNLTKGGMRYVEFLDNEGYTALYRKGHWFYQKFHSEQQSEALIKKYGFSKVKHQRKTNGTSWQIIAKKSKELPLNKIIEAVTYEFNLPLSPTMTIDRYQDVINVLSKYYD